MLANINDHLKRQLLALLSGIIFQVALIIPEMGFLIFFAFAPILYALQSAVILEAAWLGSIFGVVSYIFIPASLISFGFKASLIGLLVTGVFFSCLFFVTASVARISKFLSVWVAFLPCFTFIQYVGENYLSIPISLSVTLPMERTNGNMIISIIGAKGFDFIICATNALFPLILGRHKTAILLIVFPISTYLMLLTFLHIDDSKKVEDSDFFRVSTVDAAIRYDEIIKYDYELSAREEIDKKFDSLTEEIISNHSSDLILWPENANGSPNKQSFHRRSKFKNMASIGDYKLIIGSNSYGSDNRRYNTAEYIDSGFFVGHTEKNRLVPVVESEVSKGKNSLIYTLGTRLGVGICFDVAFRDTIASMISRGASALIILSNDSWFGFTGLKTLHLRYAQMRAIEFNRYVLFFSNTGPSMLINTEGRVISGYLHTNEPKIFSHLLKTTKSMSFYKENESWITACTFILVFGCLLFTQIMVRKNVKFILAAS